MGKKKHESLDGMLDRIKRRLVMGQPTKYNPKEHIPLLVEVFGQSKGVAAFCAEAVICQSTFYNWLKAHADFKEAYDVALNVGQMIWESPAFLERFNPASWRAIMRNRFHYEKVPLKKLQEKANAIDRFHSIWQGLEEGTLDGTNATKMAQLVVNQVQVEERVPLATTNVSLNSHQALSAVEKLLEERGVKFNDDIEEAE